MKKAGPRTQVRCYRLRATGIRFYPANRDALRTVPRKAANANPRTTKLYDRSSDRTAVGGLEQIVT
jgi:hypothetical protein